MRQKAEQDDLKFPIIIDNDKSNWNAWGNSMWPSVYLIDKKGYVRYWHYGELDWNDNGGQIIMKQRIEQLLKESGTARRHVVISIGEIATTMHHRLPYVLVPVMVLSALLALAGLYSGSLILWLGAVAAIFLFVACAIVLVLVVGNAMQARRRATRGHLYTPVTAEVQHVYRRSASRSRGSWTFWVSYTFGGKNIRNSLTILDREFAERAQATGRV